MSARVPSAILFMCGMNAIRSPMAESIARAHLPRSVLVRSAGVHTGTRDPFVDAVIAERGLPADEYGPQDFHDVGDGSFDLVIALSEDAHAEARERARTVHMDVEFWPMPDPSLTEGRREQVMDAYRALADALEKRITERFG